MFIIYFDVAIAIPFADHFQYLDGGLQAVRVESTLVGEKYNVTFCSFCPRGSKRTPKSYFSV